MTKNILGQTYFCPVCGAELSVIRGREGEMDLVCCERPMVCRKEIKEVYHCPSCGAQVMLIKSNSDNLEPVCCHVPMQQITTSSQAA